MRRRPKKQEVSQDTFGRNLAIALATRGRPEPAAPIPKPVFLDERAWPRYTRRVCAGIVAIAASVSGYLYWESKQLVDEFSAGPSKRATVRSVSPQLGVRPEQPAPGLDHALTILAIGADKAEGPSDPGRSDTVMLVRIDPDSNSASMLSLPRDLRVPIPGHGQDKLNAAYSRGGAGLLTKTVREYMGVQIDHFVQVDFQGFSNLVSAFGGVYLPVDGSYHHDWSAVPGQNWATIHVRPGYQRLDRQHALEFVRFRHLDTDFHRAARQQLFMTELGRQLRAAKTDPATLRRTLRVIARATTSDLDGVGETLRIANSLRKVPPDNVHRVTIAGSAQTIGGASYVVASRQQKRSALMAWAGVSAPRRGASSEQVRPRPRKLGPVTLTPDRALAPVLRSLSFRPACTPTALPPGYRWGTRDRARSYRLSGHSAAAAWATRGSGRSALWMWTNWADPPVLAQPTRAIRIRGRALDLYYDSKALRMVAWRLRGQRAWLTNTLRNELSNRQMLALAASCR